MTAADLMKTLGDEYCLTIDLEYIFCTPSDGGISKVAQQKVNKT